MFAFVEGILAEKNPTHAVVLTHGIGYNVLISLHTFDKLKGLSECRLYTHLSIKEDAHILYGFFDESERKIFRHLISVSGVGASTARLILSSLAPEEVVQTIVSGNATRLQSVKGIGAKSAQRIVLELKDKLTKEDFSDVQATHFSKADKSYEEAVAALVMLGFVKSASEKALDKIIKADGNQPTEVLIRKALQIL